MRRIAIVLIVVLSSAAVAHSVADKATPSDSATSEALYTAKDGDKVDAKTLQGWKTWRALACERCHGAEQEGLVGPPLVESMKVLSKEEFHTVIMNGRPEKGMPPFNASAMVTQNWEGLYAYLKGRSDGQIKPGRLSAIEQQ
jgi:mono/diheme cytochrome c family protein